MLFKKSIAITAIAATAFAAYAPPQPWSTLTPSGTYPSGQTTYQGTFGIAIATVTPSTLKKRGQTTQKNDGQAVNQIADGQVQNGAAKQQNDGQVNQAGDGQVQNTKQKPDGQVNQAGDGQIQSGTKQKPDGQAVNQISDSQAVNQISDGQVQNGAAKQQTDGQVNQAGDGQTQSGTKQKPDGQVNQIGDGQVQNSGAKQQTDGQVNQAGDGQTQSTKQKPDGQVNQIGDGQIQHSGTMKENGDGQPINQISDGQPQSSSKTGTGCKASGTLALTLKDSVLYDSQGRIGSIVSNRQFQFDGPPPQAGSIYAKGWSITPQGNLALGLQDIFYSCVSGSFSNIYDQSVAPQCSPVYLKVIKFTDC